MAVLLERGDEVVVEEPAYEALARLAEERGFHALVDEVCLDLVRRMHPYQDCISVLNAAPCLDIAERVFPNLDRLVTGRTFDGMEGHFRMGFGCRREELLQGLENVGRGLCHVLFRTRGRGR